MAICNLTPEKQLKLIGNIILRLEKFKKDKAVDATGALVPFDLNTFVENFYNDILARTNNPVQATGLTQMVPGALDASFTHMSLQGKRALMNHLTSNGLSRDEVIKLAEEFEKDIQSVNTYLQKEDPNLVASAEANLTTHPKPKPTRGRPTNEARTMRQILSQLQDDLSDDSGFNAKVLNSNSTTGQEAEEGIKDKSGRIVYTNRKNPLKIPYYNTLKAILNAIQGAGLENAETLTYDDHTGFKLAASINDKGERILTITNNEGTPINFNDDGTINRENGGQEMYYSLRMVTDKDNQDLIDDVTGHFEKRLSSTGVTGDAFTEAVTTFKKEFTEERARQRSVTDAILDTLNKNPGKQVLLDITGGSKGYIQKNFTNLNNIWDTLSDQEKNSIGINDLGRPYITIATVEQPIELRAQKIINNAELTSSIIKVLTQDVTLAGKPLSNEAKVTYVEQFIYSGLNISNDSSGKIALVVNGKLINLTPKDLNLAFQNLYLQVNNDLLKNKTYDFFDVQADGTIKEPVSRSYVENLLMPYLQINAVPNADGKIEALNGYFTWNAPNDIITAMEPVVKQDVETTEIAKKAENNYPEELEISKLITQKGTPAQVVEAMRWWKNSPLSKHIKLEVLTNIANSNAWATWNVSGITLFEGSDYTHAYHEAWHGFSQLYLSKDEKSRLYSEAAKQSGTFKVAVRKNDISGNPVDAMEDISFKTATPRQLEEYIAEEFRKFAMSGGKNKPTGPVKRSLFQKIWDYLKAVFTGVKSVDVITQPDSVNALSEIFNKLYQGNINNYTPNVENVLFDSANAGIVASGELGEALSYAESKLITNSIDGLVSAWTTNYAITRSAYGTTRVFATRANRNAMFNSVKTDMIARLEELTKESTANQDKWDEQTKQLKDRQIYILKFATDNWGDPNNIKDDTDTMGFYKNHSEFSDQMLTPLLKEDGSPDIDSTNEEDIKKGLRGNDRKNNEISSLELADSLTLYLVKSLIEVDPIKKDALGNPVFIKNELGFPKLASFPNTWNSLVRNISGSSSLPELYERLLEKSQKGFPIYTQILQKLGDQISADKEKTDPEKRMWLKFWQDFNKPRIPLIAFIVNKDYKGVMTYKVGRASAEYFKTIRKWGSDFISNPGTSRYITKSTRKDDKGTNYLNLKEVVADFIKERELKVGKDKVEIKYEVRPGKQFEFFKAIGINLTDNQAVRDELTKNPDITAQFVNYIALANNAGIKVSDITKFFSEGFIGKKFYTTREGLLLDVPNIAGRLKELSEIETENSDEYSSLSRTTPDGNKQYEQALNSTMTVRTDALNKAKTFQELYTNPLWQHMQYLDFRNNPAARSSKLLNSLFILDVDPAVDKSWGTRRSGTVVGENNTLDIFNLSGSMVIESDYSDHGVAHSGMTGTDKFITDFHSLLSAGYAEQARHGSKSSAFSTKAARVNTYAGKKQNHLYIDTADFIPAPGTNRVKGVEEAFKIVKGYIQAEIERIQIVKKDPEYYKNIKGFKKADKFTLFDNNILSSQMKRDLLSPEFIDAIRAAQIPGMLNHDTLTPALSKFPEISAKLEADFKTYFKKLIEDYKSNMLAATQVKEGDKVLYDAVQPKVYEDIMASLGYSQNQISETLKRTPATESSKGGEYVHTNEIARLKEAAMRSFAFNSWIHKVEMMTIYYGDAVQYNHEKDEFNKRNSTFGSAGYIFATDNVAINYINTTKNSKGEVNHMRAYSETVNGPVRVFDGTFNTAIIKDNEFRSPSFDGLVKMFTTYLKGTGVKASEIKTALYGEGGSETDVKGGLMKPYNKVNEGDGQGWVSFDAYKILKELEGKWSPAQDKAYNDTIAGKVLSPVEIAELFPVYKVQYAGTLKTDKGRLPVTSIHKFSLFPLIPTVVKDTPMETLHKSMIDQKIDYALFESGSKLSSITSNGEPDSIFEGHDTAAIKKDFKFTPNVIFLKYLKNQLDLNNNFKGKTTFSTQLRKLLTSGLIENGVPVDFMVGKSYDVRKKAWENIKTEGEKSTASSMFKLARTFEKRMSRVVQLNLEKLVNDVGWTWDSKDIKTRKPVGDMIPMVKFIREELAKQGFAKHEIDFIDVDSKGELVRDLSTSFSAPKIERLLMAIVNNRIVKQNMTGEALVQVSVAFTQNNKFQKPTEKQNELYGASGLPFYQPDAKNPTKACKVKIALQGSFEHLFNTVYIKDGKVDGTIAVYDTVDNKRVLNFDKSLARLNEMVKNDQWLDQDNNRKKITLTGVRIPVQGLNSMEFMEVYEFLPPIAGPIIILPSEIVAKSGGDFDVDKLTTYFPHITRAGTWINSDTFPGDNWKEEIDKRMIAVDAKIHKLFGSMLGETDTLNNIKKKLKGDLKSHNAAIQVLKAKRDAEIAKNKTYLDAIKEEFDTLGKKTALQEDFKKILREDDDEALIKRLEAYNEIGALKTKGEVIYNAYQQIKKSEIKEITDLINQEYVDKKVLVDIKVSPEFQSLLNEYTDLQDQRKNFTKSVQNSLLNDIVSILSLNHNAVPLLTANDTHLTQPISEKMESKVQTFDFKASRMTGETGVSKGVSPSRILEEDFNLKKHQDNIMGMGSLGIVAIDNAYNPIFNSAGAYIEPEYTLPNPKLDPKTGEPEFVKVPTKVYLNHNTVSVDKEGKKINVISLSNLKDKAGKNSIAEIDSQLVNGFVDVEKNAWVAFIQGNKENTPMLLFLNKIGVPFEEAVTFVSNPIIRKYVEEQKKRKGALGDLMGLPYDKTGVKRRAKEAVWEMLGHGGQFPGAKVRFEMMEKALNGGKELTLTNMDKFINAKTIENLRGNKIAEGAFLHYIYLEELMSGYNDLKSKTNVDTKKTGSLFDAQLRVQAIDELYKSANMPKRIIDYIENESSISGFFVQQFAHDLWSPLFKLRSNSVIDKYLTDILSNYAQKTAIENITGYSPERMVSEFKNDFMSYLFINQIKSFEVGASVYKGIRVNDSPVKQIAKGVPVKYAEGINKAAYVKEVNGRPNLFVNIKNIRKEFYNKSYLDTAKDPNNYTSQGLAPVNTAAFSNSETGQKEYQNFVMEREYLRNSFPISNINTNTAFINEYNKLDSTIQLEEGEIQADYENRIHKMAYENFLRDKALDNTFNFYQLFKSGDKSYPKRMMELIDKYPHLTDKYSVLKQFAIRGRKKGTDFDADHLNLLLKDARDLDKDSMTQYYDDITALSTSKSLVLGDSKEIAEENNFINDFFKRLSLFAFQQSGMSAGTETAFTSILPYEDYSKIITEAAAKVEKQLTWKKLTPAEEASYKKSKMFITRSDKGVAYGANVGILNQFLDQFKVNNSTENKSGRVTGKDWTKKLTPEFLKGDTANLQSLPMSPFIHQTAKPGIFILSREGVTEEGVKIAINNQAIMQLATANADNAYFVFNDSIVRAGLTSEESKNYLELYYQNRPMMFAHPTFGVGMGKGIKTYTGAEGRFKAGTELSFTDPKDLDALKALIDQDIAELEALYKSGKKLVFVENGYAQELRKQSQVNAPEIVVPSNAEFTVADTLPPIEQNFTDGQGGRKMQDKFKGKSTMDLIISGDRTRTTRANTDIQRMAKDYGLSKISDLVGRVIRMTDKTGRQVYTKITKVTPFTQQYQDQTWQKEGWEKSVTDKHVGQYPYAIEFEVIKKSTQVQPAILPTDKIIFGHPGIGKTYLKESGRTDVIDFDSDYKVKINKKFKLPEGFKARNVFQKSNKEEYNQAVRELWEQAKQEAKRTGKILFASDMILLREFAKDFDKVINISKETFIERAKQRNDYNPGPEGTEGWKASLDKELAKVSPKKVITTDKYLSELLPTQVQSVLKEQLNAAPKSEFFVYLSQQLSEKFGYVNPGSEREVSIMEILSQTQIITQQDIDERERTCK